MCAGAGGLGVFSGFEGTAVSSARSLATEALLAILRRNLAIPPGDNSLTSRYESSPHP